MEKVLRYAYKRRLLRIARHDANQCPLLDAKYDDERKQQEASKTKVEVENLRLFCHSLHANCVGPKT